MIDVGAQKGMTGALGRTSPPVECNAAPRGQQLLQLFTTKISLCYSSVIENYSLEGVEQKHNINRERIYKLGNVIRFNSI
jgi:hypothetical protein